MSIMAVPAPVHSAFVTMRKTAIWYGRYCCCRARSFILFKQHFSGPANSMPVKALPTDLPILPFPSREAFDAFLEQKHATARGIHLKLAKKSTGIPTITAAEAVEVALCYGWIDGQANSVDENWWLVRYTPRRAKSIWSKKNVDTVERLIAEGRMHIAGIAAMDAAKADGRWDRAYAGPATIAVSNDFNEALNTSAVARMLFQSLNKSDRYSVLWRVETASVSSRPKRIRALVDMLATGNVPGKPLKKTSKSIKTERPKTALPRHAKGRFIKNNNVETATNTLGLTQTPRRSGLRSGNRT